MALKKKKVQSFEEYKKQMKRSPKLEAADMSVRGTGRFVEKKYAIVKGKVGEGGKRLQRGVEGKKIKGLFKRKERTRVIQKRATRTRRVLSALGITSAGGRREGAGRPEGTGKYQLMGYAGVHDYNRAMAQKRAQYRQYQMEQVARLRKQRGLTREQVQQLQYVRSAEQPPQVRAIMREGADPRKIQVQQVNELANDELQFRKWSAEKTVSPNTQRMLMDLKRIQNKAQADNIEQQRRIYEKRLLADQGNLLKARNLFGADSNTLNILEMEGNILTAPNVFKENPEDNILKTKRLNIMQTQEGGNNLQFF